MDELLALMDDDGPAEESEISSSTAEVGEQQRPAIGVDQSVTNTVRPSAAPAANRAHPDLDHSLSTIEPQGRVEISIDKKLGIRMIKRLMSSIDLMDLISTHPYHSPATISAMSLAALNRLLVEPTSVVSAATVSGKTNIVTVGIVFTNTGTRISANGRAFSILKIGSLVTGSVVSVFLFGEAYSKHCAKCPPGTVVALVSPSLLPPKEDSRDTTVSLSVGDPRQLIPVAQARDYGVCKATVSAKRPDGQWISNGGRCKHHVDLRVSPYCETHRNQQTVKNGPVKQGKGLTFMQQQKMEHGPLTTKAPIQAKGVMTMQMPGVGTVVTNKPSNEQEFAAHKQTSGRLLNAPMHMKKQVNSVLPPPKSRLSGATSRQPVRRTMTATTAMSRSQQSGSHAKSTPLRDDWLNPTRGQVNEKKTPLTGKKRAVNKDMGDFDGSVAIPKPSKLFRRKAPVPQRSSTGNQHALTEAKVDSIRQKQCLVAERQKENILSQGSKSHKLASGTKRGVRGTESSTEDALKDSLFGQFSSMDTEQLLNAKSRFTDEADAEAYAKSRRVVTDLERREEQKMHSKKKHKATKESAIQKEWVCATCNNKTTKTIPKLCLRAKHKVNFTRTVKKSDTVQERRLKLDEKSAEDGGLKLGAGVEWDRRRF